MGVRGKRILKRFFNKLKRTSCNCWEWQGYRNRSGYGKFYVNGRILSAHRWLFFFFNPQANEQEQVLHTCDNPACCNIRHLWLGDNAANMLDKARKGRNPSKLTPDQVRDILKRAHKEGRRKLAEEYGVTVANIDRIVWRLNWKWINV